MLLGALAISSALLILAIAVAIGPITLVVVSILMPIYLSAMAFLAMQADERTRECIAAVLISVLSIWAFMRLVSPPYPFLSLEKRIFSLLVGSSVTSIGRACFGIGIVY